jgi:hypothetical protein
VGEPPDMSARDREDTKKAAERIVEAVRRSTGNAGAVLIGEARALGVPPETLILWFAQLALETP